MAVIGELDISNPLKGNVPARIIRGMQADFEKINPTLTENQWALIVDLNMLKFGNNTLPFNDLPYFGSSGGGFNPNTAQLAAINSGINKATLEDLISSKERLGSELDAQSAVIDQIKTIITNHLNDNTRHITQQEREQWNNNTGSGDGIEEAPKDGKKYGRQDGNWSEINEGSGDSSGGGYKPPAGGIPRSDLAQGVQNSLTAADNAAAASDLSKEVQNRINGDNNLNSIKVGTDTFEAAISDIESDIEGVNNQITSLWQAENALENKHNTLDQKVTDNIINEADFDAVTNTLAIKSSAKTINALLVLASASQNGVMPKEVYALIEELAKDVASLKGISFIPKGTISVDNDTFEAMSDTDRTALVLSELDLTEIDVNDGIKTSDKITWIFNESETWVPWGDTVIHIATSIAAGIVMGVEDIIDNRGKIFVEVDGTQSVVGWDWLVSLVNGKYEKPSTGIPKSDLESAVQTAIDNANNAVLTSGAQIKSGNLTVNGILNAATLQQNGARVPSFSRSGNTLYITTT